MKMTEYILEIRSSINRRSAIEKEERIRDKNMNNRGTHKAEKKRRIGNMSRKRSESSVSEKYISFKIKRNEYDLKKAMILVKILGILFSNWVIWNVLNNVKIIEKIFHWNHESNRLIYLMISLFIIKEIYQRINYDIEEKLTIIPNFGIQLESIMIREGVIDLVMKLFHLKGNEQEQSKGTRKVNSYLFSERSIVLSKEFIHMGDINDIVIQEGFIGMRVVYFLSVVMKDGRVVVVFPYILPRRKIIESVWKKSKEFI